MKQSRMYKDLRKRGDDFAWYWQKRLAAFLVGMTIAVYIAKELLK